MAGSHGGEHGTDLVGELRLGGRVGHPQPQPRFLSGRAQQRDTEVADRGSFEREIGQPRVDLRNVGDQVRQRRIQHRFGPGRLAQTLRDQSRPVGDRAQVVHAVLAFEPAQRRVDQWLEHVLGQVGCAVRHTVPLSSH
jgi:hypothetical protein